MRLSFLAALGSVLLLAGVAAWAARVSVREEMMLRNERRAVESLREIMRAQEVYRLVDRDRDGVREYAVPYGRLWEVTHDKTISLISGRLATARAYGGVPHHGYLFREIDRVNGLPICPSADVAVCAVPALHGRTGRRTFVARTDGTVWARDRGPEGRLVGDFPRRPRADGWRRVRTGGHE
jgi:hypothetical protein